MCETHGDHTRDTLDEACWKGYHKEGNKKMFGKTYPNCVKNEDVAEGWFSSSPEEKAKKKLQAEQVIRQRLNKVLNELLPELIEKINYNQFKDVGPEWFGIRAGVFIALPILADSIKEELKKVSDTITDKLKMFGAVPDLMTLDNERNYLLKFNQQMMLDKDYILKLLNQYIKLLNTGLTKSPTIGRIEPTKYNEPTREPGKSDNIPQSSKLKMSDLPVSVRHTAKNSRNLNLDEQGIAEEQHSCPHCGGEMVSEELMNEKKDACYYKVKSRYKVWPSAYASGALVKCRKKGASNWGNGGKKNESSILEGIEQADESLHDWFTKEKWVRMDTKGNIKGPCAREPGEGKPKCLPQSKAHSLGKKGRASAAARKRREDPNPDRRGSAINVNTKRKTNEVSDERLPT
jgi:hypothetical protein